MKTIFAKDLQPGENISDQVFAVKSANKRSTKDGKPFFDINLSDKTGSVKGKIWSDKMADSDEPKDGMIVKVFGKVESFNDTTQLNISALRETKDYSPEDLTAVSHFDLDVMEKELDEFIDSIKNKHIKELLANIFTPEFKAKYKVAPAAYTIHHAYKGGMLEHVLDILKMGEPLLVRYPKMNRDLFIVGAILHDLGKMEEYDVTETAISMAARGRLLGHVYMGAEYVVKNAPKNMPQDLLDEVVHLILSHQELKEFGSPVVPKTTEAIALATLDDTSFKVNTVYHTINDGGKPGFTTLQRHLGTELYRSPYLEELENEDIPF